MRIGHLLTRGVELGSGGDIESELEGAFLRSEGSSPNLFNVDWGTGDYVSQFMDRDVLQGPGHKQPR